MKRCILVLCILLFVLFAQISTVKAVSKTYTWHWGWCEYEIFIVAPDNWRTDTATDVVFRLTLVQPRSLNYAQIGWVQIIIKSPKFIVDSGKLQHEGTLREASDYLEKTIPMIIPSWKLDEGETVQMSIAFTISLDELDVHNEWWNHVGSSGDDPIYADVYRPIFWETTTGMLVIGVVIGVIAIVTITGVLLYRKRKKPTPTETVPKM